MVRRRLILLSALAALAPGMALAAHGEEGGGERKKGGGANYIQLQTMTGTTFRADGRRGVMTVEAGLDVPDGALRARAQASTPRLRAAFAQVVQSYAQGLPANTAPNADFLSLELQRQTDFVLGRRGAKLLLGSILVN